MKKLLFLLISSGLLLGSVSTSLAYTSADCRMADELADEDIIRDHNGRCEDYRLDDFISRQEAAGIALTVALSCDTIRTVPPTSYRCENIFSDVSARQPNEWVCRVAETLADYDIVTTSHRDRLGRPVFRPIRNVTKAETLAMLMDGADIPFRQSSYSSGPYAYGADTVAWQKPLIETAYYLDVIDTRSSFYPNRYARRSEVFEMALQIVNDCDGGFVGGGSYSDDVEVRVNDITVDEDDDYAYVPITLSGRLDEDLEVEWRTREDTAEEDEDYEDDSGTLRIRAGSTREEVRIRIEDDNRTESTERFYLEIIDIDTDSDSRVTVEDDRGYVNIRDDDRGGSSSGDIEITIEDVTVDEDDDEVELEICLSEDAEGDVDIDWETVEGTAEEDEDYEETSGRVVIDRGDRCEEITIEIIDDNRSENTERFYVEITDADSDDNDDDLEIVDERATVTIRDDESGSSSGGDIEVEIDDVVVDEDDDEARVTVTLSDRADGDVEIRWRTRDGSATGGSDYDEDSGTLRIREGDRSDDIEIEIFDDNRAEVSEFFYIEIISVHNDGDDDLYIDDDRGIVTIRDDDGGANNNNNDVEIEIEDEEADEDDGEIEFVVRLSDEADDNITLRWRTWENTARDDEDYHHDSGTIRIREGDRTATITIDLIDDNRRESLERFYVEIYGLDFDGDDDVEIVDDRAYGYIRDDD